MEKRALLAVVLSLLVLFLYQYLVDSGKEAPIDKGAPQETISQPKKSISPEYPGREDPFSGERYKRQTLEAEQVQQYPEKEITVATELYTAIFTTRGAALRSWRLSKYKDKIGEDAHSIDLIPQGGGGNFHSVSDSPRRVFIALTMPYSKWIKIL